MRDSIKRNSFELLLSLLLISLFNFPKFAPIVLVLTIFWCIIAFAKKQIRFQFNPLSVGFIGLYVAYVIGMIWTRDSATATFYLENKLSFLIIPLFFSFSKKAGLNFGLVLKGLITAVVLSFVWNICIAIPCYLEYYSFPWCFMKSHLSAKVHPTYMTVGAQMSIFALLWLKNRKLISTFWTILTMTFLVIYIFLLLSLSGVLFFLISSVIIILVWLARGRSKKFIFMLFTVCSLLIIGLLSTKYMRMELKEVKLHIDSFINSPEKFIASIKNEEPSSSQVRIILWLVASEEVAKHPFGVGTANVDEHMGNNLRKKGLTELANLNYNPHNQFLHIWLEIGLMGLAVFLFILYYGMKLGWKTKNWILVLLVANLAFNCLFESMLQKQSGIMFYPLMMMIILIYMSSQKELQHE